MKVPADDFVSCNTDTDCPSDFRCQLSAERCIPTVSDDTLSPQLLSATLDATISRAGEERTLNVEINEALLFPPTVTMGDDELRQWTLGDNGGNESQPTYQFTYTPLGDEDEGRLQPLKLKMTDKAGNDAIIELAVELIFDFSSPNPLEIPQGEYLALGDNPLNAVSALGPLVEVVVNSVTDEELSAGVLHVRQGDTALLQLPCEVFGSSLRCTIDTERGQGLGDGEFTLALILTDVAGNQSPLIAAGPLIIDTQTPALPDVEDDSAIVYTRIPWILNQTGELRSSFSVQGNAGAVESLAHVQIATASTTSILASTQADGQGAFGQDGDTSQALSVGDLDQESIFIRAIDSAGNASAWTWVRNVDWVVTMAGKEAGESFGNPHRFERRARFSGDHLSTEVVVESSGLPLSRIEGGSAATDVVQTEGAAEWQFARGGQGNDFHPAAMAANLNTSTLVLLGPDGETYVHDDSGIERVPFEDNEGDGEPADRFDSAMAFEGARASMVLFGGRSFSEVFGDTWRFTGRSWTMACAEAECDGPTARYRHSMTYDALRRRTLLFGGQSPEDSALRDLWAYEDGSWNVVCDGGSCADALPSDLDWSALAFDRQQDRLILVGGTESAAAGLWIFEDGSWVDRCLAGACVNAPVACNDASAAFDDERGLLFLLSRHDPGGNCDLDFSVESTHIWNDTAFETQTVANPPLLSADIALGARLAYHPSRQRIVRAGGRVPFILQPTFGEPAELTPVNDGHAWVSIQNSPEVASVNDDATYNDGLSTVVAFFDQEFGRDQVRLWNGNRWASSIRIPSQLQEDPVAIAYLGSDPAGTESLLLGAQNTNSDLLAMWEYNISEFGVASFTERWSMSSCASPPNCDGPFGGGQKMVSNGTEVIAFGGAAPDLPDQTWAWTGSGWEARCTDGCLAPPGRMEHAMTSDPVSGDIYLYGGSSSTEDIRHEVWRFRTGTWTELGETGVDTLEGIFRNQAAMSFDPERESLLVFGGTLEHPFFVIPGGSPSCGAAAGVLCGGPYEYDVAQESWHAPPIVDLLGDGEPQALRGATLSYDTHRGNHILRGGEGVSLDASSKTWLFHSPAQSKPAHIFNVAGAARSSRGALADTLVSARLRWVAEASAFDSSGVPNQNVVLWMWQYDAWLPLNAVAESVTGSQGGATLYTAEVDLSVTSRGLFTGTAGNLYFAASPEGINQKGSAIISSDYVEMTLRYRAE